MPIGGGLLGALAPSQFRRNDATLRLCKERRTYSRCATPRICVEPSRYSITNFKKGHRERFRKADAKYVNPTTEMNEK